MSDDTPTLRLAIIDDYDVVAAGVAHMFDHYADRIEVAQLQELDSVDDDFDVTLLDTFALGRSALDVLDILVANPRAKAVVLFTWVFDREVIDEALRRGAAGYLSKALPAAELVDALGRIAAGEIVVSDPPASRTPVGQDWPGREEGLSERESEILSLITQGHRNAEIADLMHLSINSIKTHIRSAYAKIGVRSRTQAVRWAFTHGFQIDEHPIRTSMRVGPDTR
ncbi:response regulator transcription factor [soil metagenome]